VLALAQVPGHTDPTHGADRATTGLGGATVAGTLERDVSLSTMPASGTVRIVTLEQAIADARAELDAYERTYGVPSDRLAEAFVDATGVLRETGQYVRWMSTLERWRSLTSRAAV
jgi:hypothetical protein